ncbi:putative transmembrane protein [Fagus crenata]|jgi:hypothetical protein
MAISEQVKAMGAEAMKGPSAAMHSTETLHQRSKLPYSPMKMAIAGFGITAALGYFVLLSKKKPEASALDVAKVATGMSHPDNTHPRR